MDELLKKMLLGNFDKYFEKQGSNHQLQTMLDAEKREGPSALTGVAKLWEQPYACHARLQILRCLYKYSKDTNTAKS